MGLFSADTNSGLRLEVEEMKQAPDFINVTFEGLKNLKENVKL